MRDEDPGTECHRQPCSPLPSPETLHPKFPLFWERQDALRGLISEDTIVGTLICFCTLTIITSPAQEGKTLLQWQKNTQILLTLGSEGPLTISDVQQMSPIPVSPPESQP